MVTISRPEMERLYRLVADRAPRDEVLEMIHDLAGVACGLRPPADEMRLADRCSSVSSSAQVPQ